MQNKIATKILRLKGFPALPYDKCLLCLEHILALPWVVGERGILAAVNNKTILDSISIVYIRWFINYNGMKYCIYYLAILLTSISSIEAQSNFTDTVSVVTYNINNYGTASTKSCPLEGSPLKNNYLRTILNYLNAPDIVAFEKMSGTPKTLASDSMKKSIMDSVCPNCYACVDYTKVSGYKKVNTLFYKTAKFGYLGTTGIYTADNSISDINLHKLYYKNADLATTHDTIYLNVIVVHDASGASSASQRATEIGGAMNWMAANVKLPGNYIFMGDFNTQSSSEACFQSVINPTDTTVRFYDPPNQLGNWAGSSASFANYLTQSTRTTDPGDCASTNSLLARFDHILCTNPIMNGINDIQYIPGTFKVIGQDGLHTGKALIDAPNNMSVPSDVLNALYMMSEHLPVQLKLAISKQTSLPIGLVFVDASLVNNTPYLQWRNNNNLLASSYNVERSTDGRVYSTIKTIGAGTRNINDYSFTDNSVGTSGVVYYRIKEILKDGSISYGKTISLYIKDNTMQVGINPNPVRDNLSVTIDNVDATTATVSIINSCGQVCINQKIAIHAGSNSLPVNTIAKLLKGVYVLRIQTGRELVSKVFIKE